MKNDWLIETTLCPSNQDTDFLTRQINEESKRKGISDRAYPFAFFIRDDNGKIIAGCNGSVVYGTIYIDQLWVDTVYRSQGYGRLLMEKVHELGRQQGCTMATVATMSFQNACQFYEQLGYVCDFERSGYSSQAICYFLKKNI
ncbi:GNAT family N-acetyltransferase [Candidatus Paracaedibacter symbiosus]|uniref:GNAT family N-acetyltransferase n=1 Tax=Candidatus Paracaedibacter symbiosus TaxID=244582 RepID=UPI000509A93C|nr:GNAT family N-acetyltransferase [Candidatus Paracaedibacter symbiosus]